MLSARSKILELIERGAIPEEKIREALTVARVTPDGNAWRTFFDQFLLWLGGMALAFAALFFIAYNWDNIGRFAKFGMMETLIALAIVSYWKLGAHKVWGKVSLLVATIFLGVLLALYGQAYQTGVDPWQLFFYWALLMLPWAIIGRFPAIWLVWVLLINLSIVLYHQTFRGLLWSVFDDDTAILWLVFFFNTFVLFAWELLSRSWIWLSERWAVRLLAMGSGVPITWLALHAIFSSGDADLLSGLIWAVWLAAVYFVYRKLRPELFMLAGASLSGIIVVVAFLSRHLLEDASSAGFLFLALLVIGLGTGAAIWLRSVHQEWQT